MKEVIVRAYCDGLLGGPHDERREATEEARVIGNGDLTFTLDLCGDCASTLAELQSHWSEVGERVENVRGQERSGPKRGRPTGPPSLNNSHVLGRTCPECGTEASSRDSLGQHTRRHHGVGLNAYDWGQIYREAGLT